MRLTSSYIVATVLSVVFIACHSRSQPAAAHTNKPAAVPGKFTEEPVKNGALQMAYDTTTPQNRELIEKLDAYYRTQVRAGFNGSVLIGYKGKVIYERYFGYSNREHKIPLNASSSSQLASVSKTFTGGAVLYLYEHKYIDLDAPVTRYLPQFPYPYVTIKMLLNHRSGLSDYTKWVPSYDDDMRTPISNDAMMSMMVKYKPALEFRPGTRFKYCNTNFAVLAKVIESVSGMMYSDFMSKYIFQPLGMSHTFIYDPAKGLPAEATISYKYNWAREPDMFADGVHGDKGVYSTPEDMYRWDQSFYHNTLLSNETIELAYGPCSFEKKGIKNYGLGWRMLCFPNGNKIIYHNGWWHGNNTSFYRFIKDNMTIIVLGNRFTNSIYHQAPAIYGIMRGVSTTKGFDTED
jgi:CubicO group peptidase (beta-lactamase class C family)